MKCVTWNCNGGLRHKLTCLDVLDADILVVQECEDPARSTSAYRDWASEYLWVGESKDKGIGVFAKKGHRIKPLDWQGQYSLQIDSWHGKSLVWDSCRLQSFLPCRVDDTYNLLAVWTKKSGADAFQYIGQLWLYLQIHGDKLLAGNGVVCGDFNSNTVWDRVDNWWSHSDVVHELGALEMTSLYHWQRHEAQGQETTPTFFLYRKPDRPYHIDYIFLSNNLLNNAGLELGQADAWLKYSDHVPLIFWVGREGC